MSRSRDIRDLPENWDVLEMLDLRLELVCPQPPQRSDSAAAIELANALACGAFDDEPTDEVVFHFGSTRLH